MDCVYAQELARQAIARAAFARGIKNIDKTALDAIADVMRYYIQNLGEGAKDQAELAGRAAPGVHDVLKVLDQTRPFSTNSKDLMSFSQQSDLPFPFDVPLFPLDVPLTDSVEPAFMAEAGVTKDNRDSFVPAHLPAYPPKYTYSRISTKKRPLDSQAKTESKALESKEKKQQQVKSARHSLAKIEDSVDHMS